MSWDQPKFETGPFSSVYPFGRSQPNCCHISGMHNTNRSLVWSMSRPCSFLEDLRPNDIDRYYDYLQRQAARQFRSDCRRL